MKTPSISTRLRHTAGLLLSALGLAVATPAPASDKVQAVATFSILGDLVQQIGGERVDVTVLVAPGGDSHMFQPSPTQARRVGQAQVLFSNGLGYEPWVLRLLQSARFKGQHTVVSAGVSPLKAGGGAAPNAHGHQHGHGANDPHAWQDVARVKRYTQNIASGLCTADRTGCPVYQRNEQAYQAELDALDREIRAAWSAVPPAQRQVITSHDAFAYYGQAYGVRFLAAQGSNTGSNASVQNVAKLVRQIKAERIQALFVENISDPRLVEQIARETGTRPAGTLFSDSLTAADGPAPSYLALMRHNTHALVKAVQGR